MASFAPWMQDPTQMDPTTSLGLQLLANSNTPGGFGSIFGKSALAAGQDYQNAQYNQQKLQQLQQQNQQQAFLQSLARQAATSGGGQSPQGLLAGGGTDGSPQGQPAAAGATDPAQAAFMPGVTPMPAQQAPSFGFTPPAGQQAQQQPQTGQSAGGAQGPSWLLNPPTPQDIAASTGQNAAFMRATAISRGEYSAQTEKGIQELGQTQWQQALKPKLASLDMLIKSPTPTKYMQGDQGLMAAWPQIAQRAGIDPKDYTDDNVRYALTNARNQVATSIGIPEIAPTNKLRTVTLPDGRTAQINDLTGEEKIEAASDLEKVIGQDGQPTLVPKGKAAGMQPYNQTNYGAGQFNSPGGDVLSELATRGVNLPGRSQQERLALANKLVQNNPDKSPGDIADMIRTGQLDYNGAKRSTGQLSTLSAAADIQSRKIEKDLGSLGPIVQRLPGGPAKMSLVLTNLQKDWSWNGDKDTTEAVGYVKELAGEYAKLVSGSTGMAAPAEGEMKSALGLMQSALTKNGYAGMQEFLTTTSQNRRDAVREGLQNAARPGAATGGAPSSQPKQSAAPTMNSKGWALHTDKNGNQAYVSPDGKSYEEVK